MAQRSLSVQIVRRFRGMNRFTALTNVGPEWARDCLNVIIGGSGGLEKMRLPLTLADVGAVAVIGIGGPLPAGYQGLSRIYDFQQGNGTRQTLVAMGKDIFRVSPPWTGAVVQALTGFIIDAGHLYDFITLNNIAFIANGADMYRWDGTNPGPWAPVSPTAGFASIVAAAGALTFTNGGRRWAYSLSSSVDGTETSLSPLSVTSGNVASKEFTLTTIALPRIGDGWDTLNLYSTLDGGALFYFNESIPQNGTIGGPVAYVFVDNTPDADLDFTRPGSFINEPPPVGFYLAQWGGRAFVFNLLGAPQDVVYSGYERILTGRPEAAFPPQNRLRLALGADAIAGGGVIQAGVIAFSRSAKMYMYRGIPEDIVTDQPLLFSAYLEELPWQIGCMCHQTIASTPYGLVWLASDKTVQIYNGADQPVTLSAPVHPILKRLQGEQALQCRGAYFNWLDREWYVLTLPLDGSPVNNAILFFDLHPDADLNAGVFFSNIQADDIRVVEAANGDRHLLIMQDGVLMDLQVELATDGGISLAPRAPTTGKLTAYWESGYFGNENPQQKKMFRFARFIADAAGLKVNAKLVDDEHYLVTGPLIVQSPLKGNKATINRKSRRCSYQLVMPEIDADVNVVELLSYAIPTSET